MRARCTLGAGANKLQRNRRKNSESCSKKKLSRNRALEEEKRGWRMGGHGRQRGRPTEQARILEAKRRVATAVRKRKRLASVGVRKKLTESGIYT